MYLRVGITHFASRRLAFRSDYCRACDAPRISVRTRTFPFLNIFWIPVLPLGIWRRWLCSRCGARPHANPRTSLGAKIALVILLGFMSWSAWAVEFPPEDETFIRWGRLVSPGLFLAAAVWTIRHTPGPDLNEKLTMVRPSDAISCPYCPAPLTRVSGKVVCPQCGIERM